MQAYTISSAHLSTLTLDGRNGSQMPTITAAPACRHLSLSDVGLYAYNVRFRGGVSASDAGAGALYVGMSTETRDVYMEDVAFEDNAAPSFYVGSGGGTTSP